VLEQARDRFTGFLGRGFIEIAGGGQLDAAIMLGNATV